jgi:hypothetical protein
VRYLAAGNVQGLRPLRYEKRVAATAFVLLLLLLVVIYGLLYWSRRLLWALQLVQAVHELAEATVRLAVEPEGHARQRQVLLVLDLSPGAARWPAPWRR